MLKKIFNFKLLIGFFISLLVAGTVIFLTLFGGLKRLELTSLDLRFLIRGPQDVRDSDLIIIAIDSQTYKALKKRFPFPREYYATLIENLNDAGVKLIMFDIQFTEPDYDNPEGDSILADAVKRYGNVILAGQYLPMKRRGQAGGMDKPIKVLLETGAEWGIVNEIKDADGFTRKYNLFMP
ncbi:MAG: CHASE2 domain-containing protein, partial [Fidelibacterota bacterium]